MDRRAFLQGAAAAGAALATPSALAQSGDGGGEAAFALNYAPHFGMFRALGGRSELDQIRFMYDAGFRALEDNGMMGRPERAQESIGNLLAELGMTMGVFVAKADFGDRAFVSREASARESIVRTMERAVEVAKRVNATWMTVVPGAYDPGTEWDYQTAAAVDNLKFAAEVFEPHGLVMVLEPLNPWSDHPGLFLTKIPQAYQICKAVNSPACKILNDLYHQQITEGNLIPNIDMAWDEIAYFQVGDNPGRKEPTTGEINYANVFRHIQSKGFTGVIGMEHGVSQSGRDGEEALIAAYRSVDPAA